MIKLMNNSTLPRELERIIFDDAISRDLTTARRALLIKVLWHERYLQREHLVERVVIYLGKNCFVRSAWQDTFYRDVRFVKLISPKSTSTHVSPPSSVFIKLLNTWHRKGSIPSHPRSPERTLSPLH